MAESSPSSLESRVTSLSIFVTMDFDLFDQLEYFCDQNWCSPYLAMEDLLEEAVSTPEALPDAQLRLLLLRLIVVGVRVAASAPVFLGEVDVVGPWLLSESEKNREPVMDSYFDSDSFNALPALLKFEAVFSTIEVLSGLLGGVFATFSAFEVEGFSSFGWSNAVVVLSSCISGLFLENKTV